MTASDLIELLKTCDPNARVVVNEEPTPGFELFGTPMEDVAGLEPGWVDGGIKSDLTFSLRPIGNFLVPAIRIMGRHHTPTNPDHRIVYNGLEAMKEVGAD